MISLLIFVAISPLLPITRPKAEHGSGTSNGAHDRNPADHTFISARVLLASSSAPRDHDAASASSSSPSDEPSAGGTAFPLRPTTTTVSGITTSTSTTSGRDGAFNIDRPREGPRRRNDDDKGPVKLDKIIFGLTVQAGLALMIYRQQPPQGDSSSLSSARLTTVGAATFLAFAFSFLGIMLRRHHPKVANFCRYAGILLGVLGFLFMMAIAVEGLVWLVWSVGVVLVLVFGYIVCKELKICSLLSIVTHRLIQAK